MAEVLTAPPPEAPPPIAPQGWWERLGQWWIARSRVLRPEQSLGVKILLSIYEFFASVSLAVILILGAAATQAVATIVEASYGTPAAQFGIYQSWWFVALLVLLAVNIFCAASIRYPWKRYQTGFVVTHIGLLTLLFGTGVSRMMGVDAQLQVFETRAGSVAQEDDLEVRLWIQPSLALTSKRRSADAKQQQEELFQAANALAPVSFNPGPFNWTDYDEIFSFHRASDPVPDSAYGAFKQFFVRASRPLAGAMFRTSRPRDFAMDRQGVKIEVLDYYSDSEPVSIPSVDLRWGIRRKFVDEATGRVTTTPVMFIDPVTLGVRHARSPELFPYGVGEDFRQPGMTGGGGFSFWMTGSPEQAKAFELAVPEGSCGKRGQVVLVVDGQPTRFLVPEKLPASFPLGDSGLTARVDQCSVPAEGGIVESPTVWLTIQDAKDQSETKAILLADNPTVSRHDLKRKIYGDFWYDRGEVTSKQRMQGLAGTRLDILQTPDNRLRYRSWDGHKIFATGQLKVGTEESAITAFQMSQPSTEEQKKELEVKLYVAEHRGGSRLDTGARPLPFSARKEQGRKRPAARMRMTVDGEAEEFWLAASDVVDPTLSSMKMKPLSERQPESPAEYRVVTNSKTGKSAAVTLPHKAEEIGFRIRLDKFEQKLDPGTSQASHFSSYVDFLELGRDRRLKKLALAGGGPTDVIVSEMIAPGPIAIDPREGRVYWIDPAHGDILCGSLTAREPPELVVSREIHGLAKPVSLALDAEHGCLYWADQEAGAIGRVMLAKRQVEPMIVATPRPDIVALDVAGGSLYWTDRKERAIGRADLDGKNAQKRLIAGVERAGGLAIDREQKKIYWSDLADGGVRSAGFDGSGRDLIYQPKSSSHAASRLACDEKSHALYWLDSGAGALRKFVPGGEPETLATGIHAGEGLTIVGGELWWTESAELRTDVFITMNAPVDFTNPSNGRSYRLFQESFGGPFKVGTPAFEQLVPSGIDRSEIFFSIFTVNYDPGRGIWQIGCLLIVTGIVIMFYMRAYFFMPGHRAEEST